MPFIGICKKDDGSEERLNIAALTENEDPRIKWAHRIITCQSCGGKMYPRRIAGRRRHFAHYADPTRKCEYVSGETAAHLLWKQALMSMLKRDYPTATVEYEVRIPEIGRIADILIDLGGWRVVYEIQLSAISPDELEARTYDYSRAGIDCRWYFGGKAISPENKDWSLLDSGQYFEIRTEAEDLAELSSIRSHGDATNYPRHGWRFV